MAKKKKIREFVHSLYAHNIDSSFFPISLCSNIIVDGQVRRILFSLRACLRFLISPSMSGRRKPPRCCRAPRNREPSERALCRVMLLAFFYPAPHIYTSYVQSRTLGQIMVDSNHHVSHCYRRPLNQFPRLQFLSKPIGLADFCVTNLLKNSSLFYLFLCSKIKRVSRFLFLISTY